jgi:hypothetical protein
MIDDLDHDSIWCHNDASITIPDILNRKHQDMKSAEDCLALLRGTLMTDPSPTEVFF